MARLPGDDLDAIRGLMPAPILQSFKGLRLALERDTTLDVRLRELLRLKAAQLANCRH
jgi:hypothetical protein